MFLPKNLVAARKKLVLGRKPEVAAFYWHLVILRFLALFFMSLQTVAVTNHKLWIFMWKCYPVSGSYVQIQNGCEQKMQIVCLKEKRFNTE